MKNLKYFRLNEDVLTQNLLPIKEGRITDINEVRTLGMELTKEQSESKPIKGHGNIKVDGNGNYEWVNMNWSY